MENSAEKKENIDSEWESKPYLPVTELGILPPDDRIVGRGTLTLPYIPTHAPFYFLYPTLLYV